jgi:hypothetical protein
MSARFTLATILLLAAGTTPAFADAFTGSAGNIRLTPPHIAKAPVIDGRVEAAEWEGAAVLDGFTHGRPIEGVRDTLGTECLVAYDDQNLYIAFRCRERPGQVQAPMVSRDNIWSGDWVGVSIDSYHDRKRSYFLCANPRGVQADGVDQEGVDSDTSPDFQYETQGRVTPEGFEVEFAVPFKTLRFPPSPQVTFGFNAIRDQRRTGAHMYWAPVTRNIAGYHRQMGDLTGLEGVRPGRNLEVNPYVTSSGLAVRGPDAVQWKTAENRQGLGFKYGITSALTADVTITPDFSQVEADAGVLDVNERFAIYFPEKRPFFLEGADIFATPFNLVYTRRIVDPLYGVKLTGKAGRTAIGVLAADDRSAAQGPEGIPGSLDPYAGANAQFAIARVRRDVSDDLSVGGLFTNRGQRDVFNRVGAIDARWTVHGRWTLTGQSAHSWNADPDYRDPLAALDSSVAVNVPSYVSGMTGREYEGSAHHADLEYSSRPFSWSSSVEDITLDFRSDAGFVTRPGTLTFFNLARGHLDAKPGSWYQWLEPRFQVLQVYDHGEQGVTGKLTDFSARPELVLHLDGSTAIAGGINRLSTWYNGVSFEPRWRQFMWAETGRWRTLRPGFFVSRGSEVIYEETAPGTSVNPEVWGDVRLSERCDGSISVTGTRITRDSNGSRYAEAIIPRTRLSYQFTREISLRWINEWTDRRLYDTADQLASRERVLGEDLLLSYLLRPGTVIYLGYGARLTGGEDGPLRAENHSLFMKASYLWQL